MRASARSRRECPSCRCRLATRRGFCSVAPVGAIRCRRYGSNQGTRSSSADPRGCGITASHESFRAPLRPGWDAVRDAGSVQEPERHRTGHSIEPPRPALPWAVADHDHGRVRATADDGRGDAVDVGSARADRPVDHHRVVPAGVADQPGHPAPPRFSRAPVEQLHLSRPGLGEPAPKRPAQGQEVCPGERDEGPRGRLAERRRAGVGRASFHRRRS